MVTNTLNSALALLSSKILEDLFLHDGNVIVQINFQVPALEIDGFINLKVQVVAVRMMALVY